MRTTTTTLSLYLWSYQTLKVRSSLKVQKAATSAMKSKRTSLQFLSTARCLQKLFQRGIVRNASESQLSLIQVRWIRNSEKGSMERSGARRFQSSRINTRIHRKNSYLCMFLWHRWIRRTKRRMWANRSTTYCTLIWTRVASVISTISRTLQLTLWKIRCSPQIFCVVVALLDWTNQSPKAF